MQIKKHPLFLMHTEFCYGNIDDGNGAHKIAKMATTRYIHFLFVESGEISSSGVAPGFLELNTKINSKFFI